MHKFAYRFSKIYRGGTSNLLAGGGDPLHPVTTLPTFGRVGAQAPGVIDSVA